MTGNIILYGCLELDGFEGFDLEELRVEKSLNEHTALTVVGNLWDENKDEFIDEIILNGEIAVKRDGTPVFSGIITDISVTKADDVHRIKITGYSHTCLMDVEKRSRSFQDVNMTYKSLINAVASGKEGAFMDKITEAAKIGQPVIQYNETDWAFLKRMASRFKTSLVTNIVDSGPQFYFGLPDIARGGLVAHNYAVKKDLRKYKRLSAESDDMFEADCIYYEVETDDIYDLGDKVIFKEREMYVIESLYEYRGGVIVNRCLLAHERGARAVYIPNNGISGCSIFGKVLSVVRDTVRIHLEIDEQQDEATAYWYPYASMYASQDETGWYCMPEVGDTVRLYHPENEESRAMAISSVKQHDPNEDAAKLDPEHRMSDPDVKYLRTAFGKELKFRPTGIDIIAKDGTVYMTLEDDGSVTLISSDKISLAAANAISMKARNVSMEATDYISIKSKGSSIEMEEDIVLKGKEVKTN